MGFNSGFKGLKERSLLALQCTVFVASYVLSHWNWKTWIYVCKWLSHTHTQTI